jgi:hypothetical protein
MQKYGVLCGAVLLVWASVSWAGDVSPSELLQELVDDPEGIGYGAMLTPGDEAGVVVALNVIRQGPANRVDREPVPTYKLLASVDPTELAALTGIQLQRFSTILSPGQVDLAADNVRTMLTALFPNPSVTRTAFIALAKRQGSRAEVLGGIGTVLTQHDVSRALRPPP